MCGIVGTSYSTHAAEELFLALQNLQHRGQDGGGIVTLHNGQLHARHGMGLLEVAFPIESFQQLEGAMGIGHTRYATAGKKELRQLQPFKNDKLGLAIAHNGNLVNFHKLRLAIQAQDPESLPNGSDSELILWYLSRQLEAMGASEETLFSAVQMLSESIVGSYSVVGVANGIGLFGFRDPNGFRPLVLGKRREENGKIAYAMASETTALEFIGYSEMEDIQPGELVIITPGGEVVRSLYAQPKTRHCMFEWVYFARVESTIDELQVYQARFNLGVTLARQVQELGIQPDIVVPVPETSRIAAIALAEQLGVPFREVLIKNRYVNRTFILESQSARQEAIRRKLYPVASELKDKKVLIVDDSIVRGNTAIKIIDLMRKSGAKEIYLASTCPPIQFPCYYGIDFPSQDELLAAQYGQNELRSVLGVDALVYQDLAGLKEALRSQELCDACLTGEYPTDVSSGQDFSRQRALEREVSVG